MISVDPSLSIWVVIMCRYVLDVQGLFECVSSSRHMKREERETVLQD